jgi:hypothetical protein
MGILKLTSLCSEKTVSKIINLDPVYRRDLEYLCCHKVLQREEILK